MVKVRSGTTYQSASQLGSLTFNGQYGKQKIGAVVHGQQGINSTWKAAAKFHLGWIYVTDDVRPDPYDTIPS